MTSISCLTRTHATVTLIIMGKLFRLTDVNFGPRAFGGPAHRAILPQTSRSLRL